MTWLHKFFGLFFIPADGRAKPAQQLISTMLPFYPLYFPTLHAPNFVFVAVQNKMVTNFLLVAVHNKVHWRSVCDVA